MRRIDWLAVAIAILALGPLAGCAAQADLERTAPAQTVTAPRVPGAIERALFAPELALAHADAIALSEPQRAQIVLTSRTTSASLALLDGQLDTVTAALADRLAESPIDEEAAVTAARAVTAVEDEIKIVHLRMLVQIRNALTAEQQARLTSLRGP